MKLALKAFDLLGVVAAVWWITPAAKTQLAQRPTPTREEAQIETQVVETQVVETQAVETQMITITDFSTQAEASQWRNVDDTVMGGVSQSRFGVTPDGYGLFSGTLSTENNGGFTSVRRSAEEIDFTGAIAVVLSVKGDGRPYEFRMQTKATDRDIFYRSKFETSGEWQTIRLPLESFKPVFRGRIVEDAPALNPGEIQQIGFLLGSKDSGDFRLEVNSIQAELTLIN